MPTTPTPTPITGFNPVAPGLTVVPPGATTAISYWPALEPAIEESGGLNQGASASKSFFTRYADRWKLVDAALGIPATVGGTWTAPWQYPDRPALYANAFKILAKSPVGMPSLPYNYALVTISYSVPTWDYTASSWYTIDYESSASFVTLPWASLQYADATKVNQDAGILLSETAILITRERIATLAAAETLFEPLVGCTNSAVFRGRAIGTCLFHQVKTSYKPSASGQLSVTCSGTILYRSVGWNVASRPGVAGFVPVTFPDGSPPYPSTDLNAFLA